MKLVTVPEMIAIEKEADSGGLSYPKMMENAGSGLASVVEEVYGGLEHKSILGLVGSGNNGGDTLVALAQLVDDGWDASAYLVKDRDADDPLLERLRDAGGEINSVDQDQADQKLAELIGEHAVLLDGVLGTGIKLPLRGNLPEILARVNKLIAEKDGAVHVVAVDCPSGVDCESGEAAEETIPAELTVTMAAVKTGLLEFPAANYVGKIRVVGIGLTDQETWQAVSRRVADWDSVKAAMPDRPPEAHKGTFGTALVVAGSVNYTGAALLAGRAAYRSGAGLVTLAVPAPLHGTLAGHFPEATWLLLPHEIGVINAEAVKVIRKNLDKPTAMLLGPGFGLEDATRDFLAKLLRIGVSLRRGAIGFVSAPKEGEEESEQVLPPLVIDADGLKLLAKLENWAEHLPKVAVLTPHPGEMAVLTGLPVGEIQNDRLGVAESFAEKWGHIVVLKGANTVVAAPDGQTTLIPVATPALASAGTGDVLAGLIVGLRAQGVEAYPAAVNGCWIHAQAGIQAQHQLGNPAPVIAGDVLEAIPQVMSRL